MSFNENINLKIADGIRTIYPPVICVVGLTGNILAVVVLSAGKHRRTTTGLLFLSLAVTDTVVLLSSVLAIWLGFVLEENFIIHSSASCKVHTFVTYWSLQISAWLLVMITLERIFSVIAPHRVKKIVTRRRVLICLAALIIGLACLNSHIFYGLEKEFNIFLNKTDCRVTERHEKFMFTVWPWIDFFVSFAIPAAVFLLGNIIIISRLKSSNRYRRSLTSLNVHSSQKDALESRKSRQIQCFSIITLVLNLAFLILVAPFAIFAIGQPYWFPFAERTEKRRSQLTLISTILLLLLYTNSAINFIVYMLCGSKFRNDFLRMCSRSRSIFSEMIAIKPASHSTYSFSSQHSTPPAHDTSV